MATPYAENTPLGPVFNRLALHERVFPRLVHESCERFGTRVFANLPGGELTFAELPSVLARAAGGFTALGVGRGDRVAILSENRLEFVTALWSQGWLGSVGVPINTGLRSTALLHALNNSGAKVLVIESERLQQLEELTAQLTSLETVVIVGHADESALGGLTTRDWNDLMDNAAELPPADVEFSDPFIMMFTSGTTGPAKGVVTSHHHHYCYSVPLVDNLNWGPGSHLYTPLPLFHAAAHNTVLLPGLVAGAEVTIRRRFSATEFWSDVTQTGATHALLIGALGNILARQHPVPAEQAHRLETLWCGPPPTDREGFASRFGVDLLYQGYAMTEVYPCQLVRDHPDKPANCVGRASELFELDLVDPDDAPVARDGRTVGEIVVRPKLPFAMMTEYHENPTATAHAFRNLWFHTGDLARMDQDGYVLLEGRGGDAIRRRGENISASEIERQVLTHPGVELAAAFGVPSDLGEDDVKLDVVLRGGARLDAVELLEFLRDRLPNFALPRYIQFRTELPLTPSLRVEKHRLRSEGILNADHDSGNRGPLSDRTP